MGMPDLGSGMGEIGPRIMYHGPRCMGFYNRAMKNCFVKYDFLSKRSVIDVMYVISNINQ
jgi:hypothetical protein